FADWRRRIVRELVFAGVGALDFEFVEEQRGCDDSGGDAAGAVADQRVVPDSDQVAAESAHIQFVEDGAADALFVTIGVDAVEEARSVAGTESFDAITVGLALVANHLNDALAEFLRRLGFFALQEQNTEAR